MTTSRWRRAAAAIAIAVTAGAAATACEPTTAPPTTTTTTTTTTTAAPPVVNGPTLAKATCASGSEITVASTIVEDLQALLDAARADGVNLCGGGYRDGTAQIAARRANCGTSYYAIYQMPSSQCSPPTAIPGTSMHEQGLAVDFTNCSSRTRKLLPLAGGERTLLRPDQPARGAVALEHQRSLNAP